MTEARYYNERIAHFPGKGRAVGSWGVRECACMCVRARVRADSLNKRQFFQRGKERAERRDGGMKGVRGGKQLAPARLCSYLIGMNNKCSLCAAVRRLKRGR